MANEAIFAPGADPESEALRRKYAMAQELQKGLSNAQGGQMVGNRFVANPWQTFADVYRASQGKERESEALNEFKGLQERRVSDRNSLLADALKQMQGAPAFEAAGPAPQGAPQEGGYTVPAQKPDLMGGYSRLAGSTDPTLQSVGMKGMIEMPQIQMQEAAKAQALARQEARDAEMARHNRATEERMAAALGASNAAKNAKLNSEPVGKTLTSGEVDKITGLDESLGTQKRLMETFKPEFAGYKSDLLGSAANTIGAKFSDKLQPQAEWWAAHEANDNIMRNKLFGASLTAGEQAAWDRTSIKPGMTPEMAQNRMAERAALIEAQRNTRLGNLGKAGYNVQNFGTAPDTFKPTSASVGIPSADAIAAEIARRGGK